MPINEIADYFVAPLHHSKKIRIPSLEKIKEGLSMGESYFYRKSNRSINTRKADKLKRTGIACYVLRQILEKYDDGSITLDLEIAKKELSKQYNAYGLPPDISDRQAVGYIRTALNYIRIKGKGTEEFVPLDMELVKNGKR